MRAPNSGGLDAVVGAVAAEDAHDQHLMVLVEAMAPSVVIRARPIRGFAGRHDAAGEHQAPVFGRTARLLDRHAEQQWHTGRTAGRTVWMHLVTVLRQPRRRRALRLMAGVIMGGTRRCRCDERGSR